MGICAGVVTRTVNTPRYRMRSAMRCVLGIVLRNVVDSGGVQYSRPVSGIYRFSTLMWSSIGSGKIQQQQAKILQLGMVLGKPNTLHLHD